MGNAGLVSIFFNLNLSVSILCSLGSALSFIALKGQAMVCYTIHFHMPAVEGFISCNLLPLIPFAA